MHVTTPEATDNSTPIEVSIPAFQFNRPDDMLFLAPKIRRLIKEIEPQVKEILAITHRVQALKNETLGGIGRASGAWERPSEAAFAVAEKLSTWDTVYDLVADLFQGRWEEIEGREPSPFFLRYGLEQHQGGTVAVLNDPGGHPVTVRVVRWEPASDLYLVEDGEKVYGCAIGELNAGVDTANARIAAEGGSK